MDLFNEFVGNSYFIKYTVMAILGLCIGSFLNVLIYRLPVMVAQTEYSNTTTGMMPEENKKSINLFTPASHCISCGAPVRWRNNIPVISWLLLRGKSDCCGKAIGKSYPLVELSVMALMLFSCWLLPPGMRQAGLMVFSCTLLALAIIDIKTFLLPDALTYPLLWAGLIFNSENLFVPLKEAVSGALTAYCILWLFNTVASRLVGKNCMGNGDFKLSAAIAAWIGWQALPQFFMLAALLGLAGIILLHYLSRRELSAPVPFGPFLGISGVAMFMQAIFEFPYFTYN